MTDHDRIREWIEKRGGLPAMAGPGSGGSSMLVVHFPDTSEAEAEQMAWEEFFTQFDRQNLALVCDREEDELELSRDFEFVLR
jgi:hypothetical protein